MGGSWWTLTLNALPYLLFNTAWHMQFGPGTFIHKQPLNAHGLPCLTYTLFMPCSLILLLYVCAHMRLRTDNTWWLMNMITTYDLRMKDTCAKNWCTKRWYFQGVFWIRSTTRLHFVHKIAVPISRSPQCSWWGLVLARMCPVSLVPRPGPKRRRKGLVSAVCACA